MPSTLLRWRPDDVARPAGTAAPVPQHRITSTKAGVRAATQPVATGSLDRTSDPIGERLASPPRPVMTGVNSTEEAQQ